MNANFDNLRNEWERGNTKIESNSKRMNWMISNWSATMKQEHDRLIKENDLLRTRSDDLLEKILAVA